MRKLRRLSFAGFLLAASCGGGGASQGGASLTGTVYEVNGQTADRSGVHIAVSETGDAMMTDADGSFAFRGLPAEVVTVVFAAPGSAGHDAEQVDLGRGRVRLLIAIEDGVVVHMCASDDEGDSGSAPLEAAPDSPLSGIEGKVKVESEDDEGELEIEVEGLEPGTEVDILFDDPSDAEGFLVIGTVAADEEGDADLEFETEDGGTLPLGATSVADLAGFAIEVRLTETGELLLTGEVPDATVPGFDDDDDEDDDDQGEDEDDDDDEHEDGDDDDHEDDDEEDD